MLMTFYSAIVTELIDVIIVQSTHVVAEFIRSMSHSVIRTDRTGL